MHADPGVAADVGEIGGVVRNFDGMRNPYCCHGSVELVAEEDGLSDHEVLGDGLVGERVPVGQESAADELADEFVVDIGSDAVVGLAGVTHVDVCVDAAAVIGGTTENFDHAHDVNVDPEVESNVHDVEFADDLVLALEMCAAAGCREIPEQLPSSSQWRGALSLGSIPTAGGTWIEI